MGAGLRITNITPQRLVRIYFTLTHMLSIN